MGWEDSGSKRLPVLPQQAESSGLGSTLLTTPNVDYSSTEAANHLLSPSSSSWSANFFHGVCWVLKGQAGYIWRFPLFRDVLLPPASLVQGPLMTWNLSLDIQPYLNLMELAPNNLQFLLIFQASGPKLGFQQGDFSLILSRSMSMLVFCTMLQLTVSKNEFITERFLWFIRD